MDLKFNIDTTDNCIAYLFVDELRDVKRLMETNGDINFYLNVRFSKDEIESLDLSRFATICVTLDGLACYSLNTGSSSFIFFKDIVGLELVEVK